MEQLININERLKNIQTMRQEDERDERRGNPQGVKPEVFVSPTSNKLNIKRHKAVWQALSWGVVAAFSVWSGFVTAGTVGSFSLGLSSLSLLGVVIPGTALLFGSISVCAGMYTLGSLINVFAPGHKAARVFKSIGKALFGVGLAAVAAVSFFNPALLGTIGAYMLSLSTTMALTLEISTFIVGVCTAISAVWPRMFKYIGHGIKCLFSKCISSEQIAEQEGAWKCEPVSVCERYVQSYAPVSEQGPKSPGIEEE